MGGDIDLSSYLDEDTKRYVLSMGLRLYNSDSVKPDQGQAFYRFDVAYDPQDPVSCAENKLAGNIGALGLQQFILDSTGPQEIVVEWPYSKDVNPRCPVPTVLQVYNSTEGDWVDVITGLATNANSDSQLARDVRNVIIRQPEDLSKPMKGIKVK